MLSKNKIVIMTSSHAALDVRIFHKQAHSLAEAGYNITVIGQHDKNEVINGVRILSLPTPKTRFYRMFRFPIKILFNTLKEKAKIYHFHDPELIPIGLILKLFTRAKIIYDIHEDYQGSILAKIWIPSFLRSFVSKIYFLAERVCFYIFDKIIVAGDDIASNFPISFKVALVRNYPLLDKIKLTDRKRKSQEKTIVLIYTGTLERERGIKEAIEAVDSLQGKARLILLGWFYDPQFESEIKDRVNDNIQLVGKVPFDKVPYFMEKADVGIICLLPSPNNIAAASRNNKLFEYMSAGLPVISSNFPSWRNIVEGNNCGLTVDPMNPEEIAKAIEYLLEQPELMEEMGRNGQNAVLEKYNWEQESIKLLDVYANILNPKSNAV